MSDASLVSFLQSELLLLSNEIKKKYPEIKEVKIVGIIEFLTLWIFLVD